ncbi:MAG: hypothetical protein WBL93_11465 [Lutisporaceae bacterium]
MKLTNREKIMLKLLVLCAFLALIYFAIIKPQLVYLGRLEKQAMEYSEIIGSVKLKANIENPVYKEYKILNAKTHDLLERYYPSIIQEKIILMLDEKIKATGIKINTIAFSEPELTGINKTETADLSSIESMTASLIFEGTYGQFYSFISKIELENRSIVLNNLKIASTGVNTVSGDILITIYAITKPFEQDEDYLDWSITGEYGKYNPFGFVQSLKPVTTAPTRLPGISGMDTLDMENRDFFISLRPITSDLPSITIGKFDDTDRDTYIYADNIGYENIELQILQDGEKFYYGYKTQNYSYPSGYGKDFIEFTPVGDELKVVVISTARNKDKDLSGAKLSVLNKTQRPLKIYVRNDDTSLPRLELDKLGDNVTVVQE